MISIYQRSRLRLERNISLYRLLNNDLATDVGELLILIILVMSYSYYGENDTYALCLLSISLFLDHRLCH